MASREKQNTASRPRALRAAWANLKRHPLSRVGPGLLTGVADDDPGGIATYSQAGAQFGLNMLWTMPFAFPLMAAIQSMCARLGRVTGKGLAANIRTAFPTPVLHALVFLLLIANTLNIAADIAAMGEAAELVTGIDRHAMAIFLVVGTVLLQVFIPYHRYVSVLKWLTLSLLCYAAVLFVVHVPWGEALRRTALPRFALDSAAATMIVAILGTTISPYLFFWQASEEVEEIGVHPGASALLQDRRDAVTELRRIRWDTWSGMFYSNAAAYCIILSSAATLHAAGITQIQTAAEAASALKPIAGEFAFLVFSLGILGVGLIGVPVLAASAAYAVCEALGWKWGLERTAKDARAFYAVIVVSVGVGLVMQFLPIHPMRALFWSAVVNGIIAVPLIAAILLLVRDRKVMGDYTVSRPVALLGWLALLVLGAAAVRMWLPD